MLGSFGAGRQLPWCLPRTSDNGRIVPGWQVLSAAVVTGHAKKTYSAEIAISGGRVALSSGAPLSVHTLLVSRPTRCQCAARGRPRFPWGGVAMRSDPGPLHRDARRPGLSPYLRALLRLDVEHLEPFSGRPSPSASRAVGGIRPPAVLRFMRRGDCAPRVASYSCRRPGAGWSRPRSFAGRGRGEGAQCLTSL